uniref:small monomeric GTPase n=1 Tax=Canis lupus dingo TaxID=286419 RepID=A0A8C0JZE8_CANLU
RFLKITFPNPFSRTLKRIKQQGKEKTKIVAKTQLGSLGYKLLPIWCCNNEWEILALKGVEFLNRDLEVDGRFVTLQIWDTAGQERFKSLRTPFYRGADCCLLTFSVDDRQSFENLGNWQKEFIYYADVKDPEHFPFVVLGNKVDKEDRQVTTEEAQAWCMENGDYPYLETSAKDDTNVTVAFEEAVRQVLAVEEQLEHCMLGHTIDLNSGSKAGSSCC